MPHTCLCAALVLAAACLPTAARATDAVDLSVWWLPQAEDTSIQAKCAREVLREFKARYPWIRLTSPTGIVIPEMSAMDTKPLMAIAGGVSPDVIYVNFRQSDTYIREGFLYPLDAWIEQMPEAERSERLLPQVRRVVHRAGPPDGRRHYWALPYSTYIKGLFWRKDLFQAARLDPERPPRTWDELYSFAKACTDPAKGTYGLCWGKSPHWSAHFYSILCSAGAAAMEERGEEEWYAAFNSPQAVDAYAFVAQLVQGEWKHSSGRMVEGVVYREPDASLLWSQGRIAMAERYLTDDLLADVNPELVGVAPVPASPRGTRASELNCAMCGIFSGAAAKGPAVLDAAWRYVHFMGSPEAKAIRTRVLVENGYGMFANPVYLERLGYTEYLRRIPESWRRAFTEAMSEGQPEPYGRNCQMIYNYMSAPADRILLEGLGKSPPGRVARERIGMILDEYVARANEKMVGRIPAREHAKRRTFAGVVALCVAVGFLGLFRYAGQLFEAPGPAPVQARAGGRRYAWLLLLPALATILAWRYLPLGWGAVMSMQEYHIVLPSRWVWLDNFAAVLWDPEFWRSLGVSAWYAVLSIVMGFFAPIILAVLLHEIPRGKVLFRTLYYLPAVISGLVVMLMWKSFFEPSSRGLLNQLVTALPGWAYAVITGLIAAACALAAVSNRRNNHRTAAGWLGLLAAAFAAGAASIVAAGCPGMQPQRWLDDPRWAMPCVVLPTVWAGMGPGCLIYLAALKTVPEELYESADLDGAGFFGKLWHVTLPTIKTLIVINFVGAVIHAFQVSEYILAMTGGGPAGYTEVLALKVFYDAFVYLRFGFATAAAWILGSLLIGFTVIQLKRLSRVEFTMAEGR